MEVLEITDERHPDWQGVQRTGYFLTLTNKSDDDSVFQEARKGM
jgi:hypothetical protein